MLSNTPLKSQTRAHLEFAEQLKTDPARLVSLFLKEFNHCLFTRLACQLCPDYHQSPQSRAFYFPLIKDTADELIKLAWRTTIRAKPFRPVMLIIGGGPGSGKLTACFNPAVSLQREISLIYDGSENTIDETRKLLEEAHSMGLHTFITYVQRPLRAAARSSILETTEAGEIPDPNTFATSHLRTTENFLSLVAQFKKQKDRLTPIVIFNERSAQAYTTSHRDLKKNEITIAAAIEAFQNAWDDLQNSTLTQPETLPALNKARRSKNSNLSKGLLIAHLLSQTLRRNVSQNVSPHKTIAVDRNKDSQTQEPAHHHLTVHQEVIESSDDWRSQTSEGLSKTKDRQHPAHIVVREKKTHEHEMETVLER